MKEKVIISFELTGLLIAAYLAIWNTARKIQKESLHLGGSTTGFNSTIFAFGLAVMLADFKKKGLAITEEERCEELLYNIMKKFGHSDVAEKIGLVPPS